MAGDLFKPGSQPTITEQTTSMTIEQASQLTEWINQRAQHEGDPCPHCGSGNSVVQPHVVQFRSMAFDDSKTFQSLPSGVVICLNCGNLRFFNLLLSGTFMAPKEAGLTANEPEAGNG